MSKIVKIPRFYVDIPQWLRACNVDPAVNFSLNLSAINDDALLNKLTSLTPGYTFRSPVTYIQQSEFYMSCVIPNNSIHVDENGQSKMYTAILGHNFDDANIDQIYGQWYGSDSNFSNWSENLNGVNYSYGSILNGYSIITATDAPSFNGVRIFMFNTSEVSSSLKLCNLSIGNYYDMTQAPNLQLTSSIEFAKPSVLRTYNGSSITNQMWDSPAKWGNVGQWELYPSSQTSYVENKQPRKGKRSWKLSFSHLDTQYLWGSNQSLTNLINTSAGMNPADFYTTTEGENQVGSAMFTNGSGNTAFTNFIANFNGFSGTNTSGTTQKATTHRPDDGVTGNITIKARHSYKVSFNLSVTSGNTGPKYLIQSNVNSGIPVQGGYVNSSPGYNENTFTATQDKTNALIVFVYNSPTANTNFVVSNVKITEVVAEYSVFKDNLLSSDNWFSQVWIKTAGGSLPFIFSPDKDSYTSDNFAICRIKQNTLKAKRTSSLTYNISMIIEEAW